MNFLKSKLYFCKSVEFVLAASMSFSNMMSCGFGSGSFCDMQYLIVATSQESFGRRQESFRDLLSIFLACACAANLALTVLLEFCRMFCSFSTRIVFFALVSFWIVGG